MLRSFRKAGLRYVVADRRGLAYDNIRGYYFSFPGYEPEPLGRRAPFRKFATAGIGRVYDSGKIVVYDLRDRP
jgi:hypothetical protein